ncbi:MAG TPA: hypothetical protein VJJ98_02005 [Sedimentisphaerales bacterium]|nr:hypothetical protein [Sedimentisphaerales bacterium]
MDLFSVLAQAAEAGSSGSEGAVVSIETFWKHAVELGQLEAFMFISFGVVWLFYGWRVFKVLVVISFALLGLVAGMELAVRVQGINNKFAGGVVGMLTLAILSIPLMRWAVGLLGAFAGAIFTAGVWYAIGLDERYILAGALIGMVGGGMISFIVFRIAVILFTSMGGGALVLTGGLALLYRYAPAKVTLENAVTNVRWVLPVALMVPMLVGLIAQHKFVKGSKDWEI